MCSRGIMACHGSRGSAAMKLIPFDTFDELEHEAQLLLEWHLQLADARPHAVMLSGGNTPLGIYRRIASSPVAVDARTHIVLSDERHVPIDSPESNYGNMREMFHALDMGDERVMRVNTDLPTEEASGAYNDVLAGFLQKGRITLALLGLGRDGHVASLFSREDVDRGERRHAVAVHREGGPDRISVSAPVLRAAERVVFLTRGPDKRSAVNALLSDPRSIPAGLVFEGQGNMDIWYTAGD